MASTYSANLRLELIGTGDQQGTWGITTNTNLGTLLEEAIGGYVSVTVTDGVDTTLTTVNGGSDQSRNMVINLTGALTATRNVICPAIEKVYIVKNATTGSQSVVFKVSGQTGVTIPNGGTVILYVDGVDARQVMGSLGAQSASNVAITGGSITGITDLAIADGGTGASTAAGARTALGAAASGANTDITSVALNNTGLQIKDTDASHNLSIVPGSNLTANRVLTLTTGDVARTFDISASNVTVTVAGAALTGGANASAQVTTLGLANALLSNTTANITIGYTNTPYNAGTFSSGTFTPSAANGNYQYYTSNGSHTIAAPSSDCAIDVLITNGSAANTVTFSGYTVGSSIGSPLTTVSGNKFIVSIRRISATSTYSIYAMQ